MAKQARGFSYKSRSYDQVSERANMRGGGFDSFIKQAYKRYKVKDGKNLVRILPPTWDDPEHYGYDIWINYGIGADNESYLSLSKMKNEPDPLAEARREADRAGDEEQARQLGPRQRVLMWVIDRDNEDEGPQLWDAPFTVDKDFVNLCRDEDTKEVIEVDNPETGCDLRFYKEGSGLATKYPASKMKLMNPAPIHEDEKQQQAWLDYISDHPAPECLQFFGYDHIAQVFNGHAKKKDPDDEQPRTRRSRPEPEADADENDRKAPPPRSGRRAAEPEDDDPPFEADEKPARRARAELEAEPEDDDPPPRRASAKPRGEDEGEGGSIRDRLRARRRQAEPADEED